MIARWERGLPFDGVCAECRAPLARGTTWHECQGYTHPEPKPASVSPMSAPHLVERFNRAQAVRS